MASGSAANRNATELNFNVSGRPRPSEHVSTEAAYAQWAAVYDTDGNFLQATDDMMLETMLPRFIANAIQPASDLINGTNTKVPKQVIDIGCGTGRNTLKLRQLIKDKDIHVTGYDNSPEMLAVAQRKARNLSIDDSMLPLVSFTLFDIRNWTHEVQHRGSTSHIGGSPVVFAISTLVLEHIELDAFFQAADLLMGDARHLLVTNMHPDMGNISQAGFVNGQGIKVLPESFAHTIENVKATAVRYGFEASEVIEKEITQADVPRLGPRSQKWVGIKCWFGIFFTRPS